MQASYAFKVPQDSWVYRTDIRAKMIICGLASVMSIAVSGFEGQLVLVLASLCYALTLRRPGALLAAYALVCVMTLLSLCCVWLMSSIIPRLLDKFELTSLLIPFMRILVMVHVVLPLALTIRIQSMLDALQSLHLPFCIYLPTAVIFRFLPTFRHDITQVAESLKMRGFRVSPWSLTRHPILSMRLLFTPLLFRSLRSSEDLGIAAELKGLGYGEKMTPYRSQTWKRSDTILVITALVASVAAIICQLTMGGKAVMP